MENLRENVKEVKHLKAKLFIFRFVLVVYAICSVSFGISLLIKG